MPFIGGFSSGFSAGFSIAAPASDGTSYMGMWLGMFAGGWFGMLDTSDAPLPSSGAVTGLGSVIRGRQMVGAGRNALPRGRGASSFTPRNNPIKGRTGF